MEKNLNFLDRNEFNYSPSKEVVEALINFVFIPAFMMKERKVYYLFSYPNFTI